MSNDNGFSSSPPGLTDNTDDENKNGSSSSSEDRVLIHESETFQIWRKGDTVIKMKCPNTAKDGDDIESRVQLMNEYTTLRQLEGLVAVKTNPTTEDDTKTALEKGPKSYWRIRGAKSCNNGKELHLEWVTGITLREWIALHPPPANKDKPWAFAETAAHIMKEIAAAVAAIHAAGVVHNDLTADHVIIHVEDEREEKGPRNTTTTLTTCCVTIISFGQSDLLSSIEKDDTGEIALDDLYSMGLIFQEIVNPGGNVDHSTGGGAMIPTSFDESLEKVVDSFRLSFRDSKTNGNKNQEGDISSQTDMNKNEKMTALQRLRDLIAALAKTPGSPMDKFKSAADIEAEFFFSVLPYIQTPN